jgi:8-oxo-dGTP pyrophosphatase MutT (NUDIX family)
VGYRDFYLWRLRQTVGNDLVLMPGAMVALQRQDQRVLLTKRADDGTWCLPAGAAEPGGSFARTAIDELAEEAGVTVSEPDLVPFAASPRPRHTRSTIPMATSPIASPFAFSREPGLKSRNPTRKSRPK